MVNTSGPYGCRRAPNRSELPDSSPNVWRSAEVLNISASYPRVLVVPAHASSNWMWSAHEGNRPSRTGAPTVLQKHGFVKPVVDCTHYCYSPFFYERIWASILIAVRGLQVTC